MLYFVDTGAFYALEDKTDKHHQAASAFIEELKEDLTMELITTNFIVGETLNLINERLGHEIAIDFGEKIKISKIVTIKNITPDLEKEAWDIFTKYKDKDFSYTDCTSFALMKRKNIKNAFAFDKHFAQMGFKILP